MVLPHVLGLQLGCPSLLHTMYKELFPIVIAAALQTTGGDQNTLRFFVTTVLLTGT